MKYLQLGFIAVLVASLAIWLFSTTYKVSTPVWSDEFNVDGPPDSSKWSFDLGDGCPDLCGWGNHELEYYTDKPSNVRVENGFLVIEAHKEDIQNSSYSSGRLVTKYKGDWLYGRVEVRAKVGKGLGTWSAIWMLPTDWYYGGWPASGEIDIMENVGYEPDSIVASAHTTAYNHLNGTQKSKKTYVPDAQDEFHVYALEWEAEEYRLYVDDVHYFTFKNEHKSSKEWPYDKRFHLIMNLAIGGDWGGKKGIDNTIFPTKMLVDYIRVYQ